MKNISIPSKADIQKWVREIVDESVKQHSRRILKTIESNLAQREFPSRQTQLLDKTSPIKELNLSNRALFALSHLKTIDDLCQYSIYDLHRIRNCGAITQHEIRTRLNHYGFALKNVD